jgi:TolA-binding protein
VLLDNFENVIKRRLTDLEKTKTNSKPSTQIQQLERELRDLQDKIESEKKTGVEVVQYDFAKIQAGIEEKEKEVKELERELARQKEISNEKKTNQNKDIIELEKKIENLK